MTKLTIKWFNAKCNQYDFEEIVGKDETTPDDIGEIMQAMVLDERYVDWLIAIDNL